MSDLLVIVFPNEEEALQARGELLSMEKQNLMVTEDAIVAVKKADGAIKLKQLASAGEFWGIRAAASGYPAPDVAGALTDFGASDAFVKGIAAAIPAGGAALFVLIGKMATDAVLAGLKNTGGAVLHTSFDKSAAGAIRAALAAQG
jgi:uncharacterized membrane protein